MGIQTSFGLGSVTTAAPVISTGTYLAGRCFGGALTFRGAFDPGGGGRVESITLDGMTTSYPFNLWLFNAELAAANTNGATLTVGVADAGKFLGVVQISGSNYFSPGAGNPCASVDTSLMLYTAATTTAIIGYLATINASTTGGAQTPTVALNVEHAAKV